MAFSFALTADSTTPQPLGDGTYGPDLTIQNHSDTVTLYVLALNATPADCAAVVDGGIRILPGGTHKSQDPNGHNLGSFFVATSSGTVPVRGIA